MFVMTTLEGTQALAIYQQHVKLEQGLRDLKTSLGLDRNMSQDPQRLQQPLSLALLGYALGVVIGEQVRAQVLSASQQKWHSGLHEFLHFWIICRVKASSKLLPKPKRCCCSWLIRQCACPFFCPDPSVLYQACAFTSYPA